MRKLTVSRMSERYAQTVLTFRITYIHSSLLFRDTRLPKTSIRITFYWYRFAAVLVKYCRVALIMKIMPDRVCSHGCSHSQKCTRFVSTPGGFCTVRSEGDKNFNREKFCTTVSFQNQPDWKFVLTLKLVGRLGAVL